MSTESYEARSRTGDRVKVEYDSEVPRVTIRFRGAIIRPAWGSQAFDDWLDWIAAERSGESSTVPVDEPDWLQDEGYHR